MNTSELLNIIDSALNEVQAYNEIAVINYGNIDKQIPKAQAALATLRQRVADLEAFYQHMVGADYQNKLMHKMNAAVFQENCSAVSLRNWKEYDALLERLSNGT